MAIKTLTPGEFQALSLRVPAHNRKKKKTKSLYDTPMEDRTFWGNDKGTELYMSLIRIEIRRSLKFGHMYDYSVDYRVGRLSKDNVLILKEYEFDFMTTLYQEDNVSDFITANGDGMVVISFDENNNKYIFTIS